MNESIVIEGSKDEIVIPIVAETLTTDVTKEVTGRVRVSKTVIEREETVDPTLMRQVVDVVRVPVDQFVEVAPALRQEGDTLIMPVVEEVLVVVKRLRVVEEIHLTRRLSEYHAPQTVTLRSEKANIERRAGDETGDTAP